MKNTKDELKKHIEDHRSAYDEYGFNVDASWEKVADKLATPAPKVIPLRKTLLRVAAVLVVAVGIGLAYFTGLKRGQEEMAAQQVKLPAEFVEARNYYASQVNSKLAEVDKFNGEGKEIAEEMLQLQKEYERLEKEMEKPVNKQEIINAMIDNYRLRLSLLESFLEEMNSDKIRDDEKNNTI